MVAESLFLAADGQPGGVAVAVLPQVRYGARSRDGAGEDHAHRSKMSFVYVSEEVTVTHQIGHEHESRRWARWRHDEDEQVVDAGDGIGSHKEPAMPTTEVYIDRGRREAASEAGRVASANSARKLQQREIAAGPSCAFAAGFTRERFRNIKLQEEYDTNGPNAASFMPSYLRNSSEIIEIIGAHDIIFALAQSGICSAFSRVTNQLICFLNGRPDEVIRSLFYNKNNESLITVSVYGSEDYSALRCKTTPIEYIRRAKPDAGFPLFETESLELPGFVEFDDVNDKVLTYSAENSTYKVFDLKNYRLLYAICDKNVQEINISPGKMLLEYPKVGGYIPLEILSIEDGKRLMSFKHLLHPNKKVDFIEQFNEKLLIKQEGENLQILDLRDFKLAEVSKAEFVSPLAFIFLYERQLFLAFDFRSVLVWNFRGELVTSFEDHLLWNPDCNSNNTYITSNQDLIISYCRDDLCSDDKNAFSINISEILTGKCLAKIKGRGPLQTKEGINVPKFTFRSLEGHHCSVL